MFYERSTSKREGKSEIESVVFQRKHYLSFSGSFFLGTKSREAKTLIQSLYRIVIMNQTTDYRINSLTISLKWSLLHFKVYVCICSLSY